MIRFTSISSGKHFISFIKCANAKLWSEELFQINDQYVLINFRDGNQLIKLCVMYFENIFAIYLRSSRKHTLLNSTYSNPASFCNNRWEYMICYQFLITTITIQSLLVITIFKNNSPTSTQSWIMSNFEDMSCSLPSLCPNLFNINAVDKIAPEAINGLYGLPNIRQSVMY